MRPSARVHLGVVHPWLCDGMGHLTSRHYVAMFDDASYHFFQQVFAYDVASPSWSGRGFADVKQVLEYKSEVRAGALVHIDASIHALGAKSITARYVMLNTASGAVAANYEVTTVLFDLVSRCATAFTPDLRELVQPWLAED